MANNRRKTERRAEIAALREEGRQAFLAGRHIQTCPQRYMGTMNRGHWENGYQEAQDDYERSRGPSGEPF